MIVVDSSVWIDHFRDRDTAQVGRLRAIRNPTTIIVGDVVLLEVLRGCRDEAHAALLERALRVFPQVAFLTPDLGVKAARYHRAMRSKGATVRRAVNLIIGAYCLENDYPVLHSDRDFDAMARHLGVRMA